MASDLIRRAALLFRERLGFKLMAAVLAAVLVGLVMVVTFYTDRQRRHIHENNERAMRKVTESVIQSLQTVMLAGYADIAQLFADRLKEVKGVVDFRILRTTGLEAFRDNKTVDEVNRRRGNEDFSPHEKEEEIAVLPAEHPSLAATVSEKRIERYYDPGAAGDSQLTFLAPILNEERCHRCHGKAHAVRGVLKLTTSLAEVEKDLRETWMQALAILAIAVTGIVVVVVLVLRRQIVRPIVDVSQAMSVVSTGKLDHEVPVIGQDEVGQMAKSFNSMTQELHKTYVGLEGEQNKLTTIILTAREGIVVTNPAGRVVLVNPAAATLLGKSAERIIADGFDRLIDDPETMAAWLVEGRGHPHTIEHNGRVLDVEVATIAGPDGAPVGSTALLRDITEEKRLERELKELSTTDGLTGLGNRRFLDRSLEHEVERARGADADLSIFMFDIDHFKKFNDTHGHDQGDRVLKAVAEMIRQVVRKVDIPCRYGGEEFLVILPSTGEDGAMILADRLRKGIEDMVVDGLKVTVSIGVASFRELKPESAPRFVEMADAALYAGKKGGRNRVVLAVPAPAPMDP
ncbi:MAG: diguanylate cyclase [Rhodospirillales bacterium]|nr:diguanylate cyclase [Rhodospirillales bacterium]